MLKLPSAVGCTVLIDLRPPGLNCRYLSRELDDTVKVLGEYNRRVK